MINPNSNLIELFSNSQDPILFVDFDGTISQRDVIDRILEEFADERWLEIENEWIMGRIGSRECLQQQFKFVRAKEEELNELLDSLELDAGLPDLLDFCQMSSVSAHIVSDGFGYYIKRLLSRHAVRFPLLLEKVGVWANDLIPFGANEWKTEFPYFQPVCADGCATCKPAVMKRINECGAPSIFIGDGLSDCFAARTADVVFAKKKLASYCSQQKIEFTAYETLAQVARCLDEAFELASVNFYEPHSWRTAA